MPHNKKYEQLVEELPALIGGKDNIGQYTHCVTRLRFNLHDKTKADLEAINQIPGVLGSQWSGEQLQVVIGQSVGDAYEMLADSLGFAKEAAVDENLDESLTSKKFSVSAILDAVAGCLTPLIPAMVGSGMVKVINLILLQLGILTMESPTYITLSFIGDAVFYFFPVLIGATGAKKFGANMGVGMALGAMLMHPTFSGLVAEGTGGSIFGMPIYAGSYASTVFPMILTMALAGPVERFFAKHSPDALRSIIEPLCTILVVAPIMLVALAPLGAILGNYLASAVVWLCDTLGFVGQAVFCALFPLLVMTGMHQAFTPYLLQMFATLGYENMTMPASFVVNLSEAAACAAVAVKTKDANRRSNAWSCATTALLAGVTEPALFGIIVPLRTPLYGLMVGSAIGGAISGLFGCAVYAFPGSAGLFGLPIFIGGERGMMNLVYMIIAIAAGMVCTFIATTILYKDEQKVAA